MDLVMDDKDSIIHLNNSFAVRKDPVATDVQEDSANEWKANKDFRDFVDLMEPSSVQRMKLIVRVDEESCIELVENSLSWIGVDF
ncbi:hypothetical protein Nepgr_003896 [Nepenthes gracilis]|uniref:Uncharacterized protein n=1 Tax=Nepenthes gracilis TaxID=150966 RepID=A0AAD3S0F4_NEPGR|nr:hypothetical protein Nepgr_003896 [Nepenthes gracilis]